jgi:hypothetical protein
MRHLPFIALLLVSVLARGQMPGNISYYMTTVQVPDIARQYYNGAFRAGDNDSTYRIIDSMETRNNLTRPFYLLLVSKMIKENDGTLSEALFQSCEAFFEAHPDALIEFLWSGSDLIRKDYKREWAIAIAGEIMISHEKRERQYMQQLEKKALAGCRERNKEHVRDMYAEVNGQLKQLLKLDK